MQADYSAASPEAGHCRNAFLDILKNFAPKIGVFREDPDLGGAPLNSCGELGTLFFEISGIFAEVIERLATSRAHWRESARATSSHFSEA